tara:strand:+ start:247 stop:1431 length:1185 start_codon:yes stop_codon:yes gene_type:complete
MLDNFSELYIIKGININQRSKKLIEVNFTKQEKDFKGQDIRFPKDKNGQSKIVDTIHKLVNDSMGQWQKGNTQEILKFFTMNQAYNGWYGYYLDKTNHFILSAVMNKNNWSEPSFLPQSLFNKKWETDTNGNKTHQSTMSKLDMWIKKGSELTPILKEFLIFTKEGKKLLKENGLPSNLYPNEVRRKYPTIYNDLKKYVMRKQTWHYVVNIEQVENLLGTKNEKHLKKPPSLEEKFNLTSIKNDEKFIKMLTTNMENVPTVNFHLEETAFYNRLDDSINIRPSDKMTSYSKFLSTTIHELAHSTGNKDRLNRHSLMRYGGHDSRSLEELTAEITVLFSLGRFNDDDLDKDFLRNNIGLYLQSWLSQDMLKEDRVSKLLIASKSSSIAERYIFTE